MWRVSWADYRGWPDHSEQPHPAIQSEDFDTREAAEHHANAWRAEGWTACVAPAPQHVRRTRECLVEKAFNREWKLHP